MPNRRHACAARRPKTPRVFRSEITARSDEPAATRTYVYVANALSDEILTFSLDPKTGTLRLVGRTGVASGVGPLTIAPDRRVLFAGLRGTPPSIASFALAAADGRLSPIATTPIGKPDVYLQTDRSGRYLLGASYTGAAFTIAAVDERGVVGALTQSTPTPPHAHCITTAPSNRHLFVTSLGGDVILQFHFAPDSGRATPNDPPVVATPKGCGPRHLVFHPGGAFAYVNGELDGSIGAYAYDERNGWLREIGRVSAMPEGAGAEPWGGDVQITPDGSFLFTSDRRTSTLAAFAVRPDSGLLERRGTVETEDQPRSFTLDPSGSFLLVAGEKSHHLACYAVDADTGSLHLRDRVPVGEKPGWVTATTFAAPA